MMAAGEPLLTSTFWQQRGESRKEQKGRFSHLSQPLKQPPTQDPHTYGHIQLKQVENTIFYLALPVVLKFVLMAKELGEEMWSNTAVPAIPLCAETPLVTGFRFPGGSNPFCLKGRRLELSPAPPIRWDHRSSKPDIFSSSLPSSPASVEPPSCSVSCPTPWSHSTGTPQCSPEFCLPKGSVSHAGIRETSPEVWGHSSCTACQPLRVPSAP